MHLRLPSNTHFQKGRPKFADKLQTYIAAAYTIKNI